VRGAELRHEIQEDGPREMQGEHVRGRADDDVLVGGGVLKEFPTHEEPLDYRGGRFAFHHHASANKYARSRSCRRYAGLTTSAPARPRGWRFQASTPRRATSSLATATATPPARLTPSISMKPSPKPSNSSPRRSFSRRMRSMTICLEKFW